jgi:hypothetical protein
VNKKLIAIPAVALALVIGATGCGSGQPSSVQKDQTVTNSQLDRYQKNQPVPAFDWSQYRQTVIDVESAEVHGVTTTTFFYNMGSQKPISSCPSLGFPVAVTAQLTNPQQVINTYNNNAGVAVDQAEPNGVYTGQSNGTYVVCVSPDGAKYMTYWEGDVNTVGGPARWDPQSEQIVLDGAPTVKVTTR